MAIKKIGLSCIAVSDIKKAVEFYSNVLGLKITTGNSQYGWYEFAAENGETLLGVGQEEKESQYVPGSNAIVSFVVDNLEETKNKLREKGVKFLTDTMEVPNEVKLVLFEDLDRNKFYLVEKLK